MSPSHRTTALAFSLLTLVVACTTAPLRIQFDNVPAGSFRVAQVIAIAQREDILKLEAYKGIIATGVADSDLVDGSVVMARIYCCGGLTNETSAEYVHSRMLYVPKGLEVGLGDFVEVKVGRPPERGDAGLLNTVTRVVARPGEQPEVCWWDPRDDSLWHRIPYCEWMPREGWVKQGGLSPAWYRPEP